METCINDSICIIYDDDDDDVSNENTYMTQPFSIVKWTFLKETNKNVRSSNCKLFNFKIQLFKLALCSDITMIPKACSAALLLMLTVWSELTLPTKFKLSVKYPAVEIEGLTALGVIVIDAGATTVKIGDVTELYPLVLASKVPVPALTKIGVPNKSSPISRL